MNNDPPDFLIDALGLKKDETPEEKFRRKMRELAKQYPLYPKEDDTQGQQ